MIEYIIGGGPMMLVIVACSIVALAVNIEKIRAFRANGKIDIRSLRAQIITLLGENRVADAITLCANTPGPVSAVMLVGLQSYHKLLATKPTPEVIRTLLGKSMEDYSAQALNAVENRLNVLATIGNTSPLFGMVGTVTGLIRSFSALAGATSLEAGAVGAGIAEALVCTAAGLIVALAAVLPYNYYMNLVERINLDIQEASSEMVEFLSMRAEMQQSH
ncbi:MAG: MotA/TolQ/ExbB proton channel family protein [Kiritimatiellae bacterium]|nr:MotA/TolQ/ExbB proton channel family protein [Kiritimatiellia bacterium]